MFALLITFKYTWEKKQQLCIHIEVVSEKYTLRCKIRVHFK